MPRNPFEAMGVMVNYFIELVAARQAEPTEDLTSAIANSTIDDEPMDMIAMMGLFAVLASAGHDAPPPSRCPEASNSSPGNPRSSPSGFASIRASAMNGAHEVVRMTSPVRHFTHLTQQDITVAGHEFPRG